MNGEQYIYTEVQKILAHAFEEFDVGPMTAEGVLISIMRELQMGHEMIMDDIAAGLLDEENHNPN